MGDIKAHPEAAAVLNEILAPVQAQVTAAYGEVAQNIQIPPEMQAMMDRMSVEASLKRLGNCPCRERCGANEKGRRLLTTHIWQECLDLVEQLRKTERGKEIYALRKETIERVFADAKDKHGMRYTHRRSLARVSSWVRLKFAALNLKRLALRADKFRNFPIIFFRFSLFSAPLPLD